MKQRTQRHPFNQTSFFKHPFLFIILFPFDNLLFQFRGDLVQDLIDGLETLKAIKVDDYGTVFIFYSVTDEFMQENDLIYKDRVYQIKYEPVFSSYAVLG